MTSENRTSEAISIFISRSNISTEVNKTGTWRFVRPRYDEKTAPCSAACPAGEDVARIEMLAGSGMLFDAVQTVFYENPFPAVCGRVCFHPCESACNRAQHDAAIAVRSLERFLGDAAIRQTIRPDVGGLPDKGKRVLIAGAGPAGLAAGYFLVRLGYSCDVFESRSEPGGVLRWGIPRYRLPEDVLRHEIDRIESMGVKIHCRTPVDDAALRDAHEKYDAVFIGCGYGRSLKMGVAGEELAVEGLQLLSDLRQGRRLAAKKSAAVIGGGNTAIDVARSLARMGTAVTLVYRRRHRDMPAFGNEVAMAVEEGVDIRELAAPKRMEAADGEVLLTLQQMKVVDMQTEDGRARVVPDGDKTRQLRVESVVTAIGARAEERWQPPADKDGQVMRLSHCALQVKRVPMIFGGDLTNASKSVSDAVASGKQAAMVLDTLFESGWEAVRTRLAECAVGGGPALSMEMYLGKARSNRNPRAVEYREINLDYFPEAPRVAAPVIDADKRLRDFSEVEGALSAEQAREEAGRCFNCGICNTCDNCRLFCPEVAVTLKAGRHEVNLDYCKGCGICVAECPRSAMVLEEEA